MDKNNLDSLMDEFSSMDGELNDNLDLDGGVDIDTSDMDGISLDELDNLEGMDLGDLDFDDIDFDDVDITNLDAGATPVIQEKEPRAEDMNLDALIAEAEQPFFSDAMPEDMQGEEDEVFQEAESQMQEDTASSMGVFDEQAFDAMTGGYSDDMSMDTMTGGHMDGLSMDPSTGGYSDDMSVDTLGEDFAKDMPFDTMSEDFSGDTPFDFDATGKSPYTAGEDNLDALLMASMEESLQSGDLADIEDISEKNPKHKKQKSNHKKTISEILFGEPDEDDIEETALFEEKKAKKKEEREKKKVERDAKKEEKNAAKQEMLAVKQSEESKKKQAKADKKRAKEEAYAAELEEEKNSKKVSTPVVIIVFVLFALLAGGVVLGTKNFSYSQVIKKATDYFERQRYRLAYNEVSGVEVKEKDQDLKDRIYTVMYVERLYESYENNMTLNRPDKALDALLRGLEKYDEHYEEAVELDIVKDIDSCRDKIINALWNTYGITEDGAYAILAMEGQEYSQMLLTLSENVLLEESDETDLQTPTDATAE